MNNMKDLIALFDNHKIYDTDIWTNVLILLVFTDLYLGVCCPQKEPGITFQSLYLQPIITQYFIDNKSEIWLLFLIAHSKR